MNVVRVMGGLGNQLFQYAFAKQIDAALDISFYNSPENHTDIIPERHFVLDKFNTDYKLTTYRPAETVYDHTYDPKREYTDSYFYGYWQKDFKKRLHKLDLTLRPEYMTPQLKKISEQMKRNESVAVHVRRSDYVKLGHALDKEYYNYNIKKFGNMMFYIFSDDLDWCFKNIEAPRRLFMAHKDYEDLYLMSQCDHLIMSNSTFSYWAFILGQHKTLTAPTYWKGVPRLI